ncbi:hypothetical protein SAMN05444360_10467 [Chryseobacterium carnipullorum]|uniref:transposase n=1 Tax=Chryseobacterium carnipullorum TaxID=1124835 RepID=UPI000922B3D3|nr:transposase [Chryseobacterium carnipullorum]SHL75221.1 hypothetical protein SAMN05444360_10467 [Chryseobacterium carnipullorum]
MSNHFKDIHIGLLIKERVNELEIDTLRICNFIKCTESEIEAMFLQKDLPTDVVLRWSKLLKFDFFRVYSQHLILYSPPVSSHEIKKLNHTSVKPMFRKNIYTREMIDFILDLIHTGQKTRAQIIADYRIPKTTLYKWISKYSNE